jgi:hypothetical protein
MTKAKYPAPLADWSRCRAQAVTNNTYTIITISSARPQQSVRQTLLLRDTDTPSKGVVSRNAIGSMHGHRTAIDGLSCYRESVVCGDERLRKARFMLQRAVCDTGRGDTEPVTAFVFML